MSHGSRKEKGILADQWSLSEKHLGVKAGGVDIIDTIFFHFFYENISDIGQALNIYGLSALLKKRRCG